MTIQSVSADFWMKFNGVDTLVQRIGKSARWHIVVMGPTAKTFVKALGLPADEDLDTVLIFIDFDDLNSLAQSQKLLPSRSHRQVAIFSKGNVVPAYQVVVADAFRPEAIPIPLGSTMQLDANFNFSILPKVP